MAARTLISAVSVPWDAFVAAFLYYTLLTLVAIGIGELSGAFIAVAYLAPVALYGAVLAGRAVRGLAAMQVDIGQTPQALLR